MSSESNSTITKEELIECHKCGSTEYCAINKFNSIWIKCRQCNTNFGVAKKLVHKPFIKGEAHVPN